MKRKCEICGKTRECSDVEVSRNWEAEKPDIKIIVVCEQCEDTIPEY